MTGDQTIFQDALVHHRAGQLEQAESLYQDALRIDPSHADALHLLGVVAHQRRQHDLAVERISRAIQIKSSFAPYHCNLGAALRAMGQLGEAIDCYREAIRLDPAWKDAYYNLGNACKDQGDYEEAIDCYRTTIELDPLNAEAYNNRGDALKQIGRLDEAIANHARAIELDPNLAEGHFNLGNANRTKGELDAAIRSYRRTIEICPEYVDAHVNLGYAREEQGHFIEAIESYERAIQLNPHCAEAHFNRGLAYLRIGDLQRGWPEYEWRLQCRQQPYSPKWPVWDGRSLSDRILLVRGEQGIGDEIMFASCLPDVIAQANHCIVECAPRLLPLFRRSFPSIEIVGRDDTRSDKTTTPLCRADIEVPLASLPRYLRYRFDLFGLRRKYLSSHPALTALWRSRYEQLGPELKVGISWRGGKEANVRRARSTPLDQWTDLLSLPGVKFVNLQYGETSHERAEFQKSAGIELHDWEDVDPLGELDPFAAQIAALDLVISVDNSTVHLAGALGVPTWVLLPYTSDWRWLLDRDDTPWYAGMKLFRQLRSGEWGELFTRVTGRLEQLISTGKDAEESQASKEHS